MTREKNDYTISDDSESDEGLFLQEMEKTVGSSDERVSGFPGLLQKIKWKKGGILLCHFLTFTTCHISYSLMAPFFPGEVKVITEK